MPGRLAQAAGGLFDREAPPVRPVGRHRVVGVADEDDARLDRDLLTREAVRVAAAVPVLVAVADDLADLLQPLDRGEDARAQLGVEPDDLPLLVGERARLGEDRLGHADLADVVEERAELEPLQRLRVEPELLARRGGPCR